MRTLGFKRERKKTVKGRSQTGEFVTATHGTVAVAVASGESAWGASSSIVSN
ncbi:MAG: hypothetical protein SGPRY_014385, partial [Prymnesium sp.]